MSARETAVRIPLSRISVLSALMHLGSKALTRACCRRADSTNAYDAILRPGITPTEAGCMVKPQDTSPDLVALIRGTGGKIHSLARCRSAKGEGHWSPQDLY